ncbi:MAG: hypothetical protein ACRDZX_15780 [Acidimicrobiales bacterium]
MPKLRFEGASLKEAVDNARSRVGPTAKLVGATRVRRGGMAGFFAREHVEVEVQVDDPPGPDAPVIGGHAGAASGGSAARRSGVAGGGIGGAASGGGLAGGPRISAGARPEVGARPAPRPPSPVAPAGWSGPGSAAGGAPGSAAGGDPLAELIDEMAESGPSSVLDLAETVNAEQTHFTLTSSPRPRPEARAREFSQVLEQIAKDAGLLEPSAPNPVELAPSGVGGVGGVGDVGEAPRAKLAPAPVPARLLEEAPAPVPARLLEEAPAHPPTAGPQSPGAGRPAQLAPRPAPARQEMRPLGQGLPLPVAGHARPRLEAVLQSLGFPPDACRELAPVASVADMGAELCRALERMLPPLPPTPRSASSILAVVGPRKRAMTAAREIAEDVGALAEEITLATQHDMRLQQEHVVASPETAALERRSWRWRARPSVVVVDAPVRPNGATWASGMLRALAPTFCWGVTEASRKPEDVAAWSVALGGLDALALVDLDGTTTPAAILANPVPVARLDGRPATAEAWAGLLCARLIGTRHPAGLAGGGAAVVADYVG